MHKIKQRILHYSVSVAQYNEDSDNNPIQMYNIMKIRTIFYIQFYNITNIQAIF